MFIAFIVASILLIFYLLYNNFQYWKKRGVKGPEPSYFTGTIKECLLFKKSLGLYYSDVYNDYPNEPFVGVFKLFTPALILRDCELFKNVLIKNFDHFAHNEIEVDEKRDLLFGKNPFVLKDEKWKKKRSEGTRCFTAAKIKAMFPLIDQVGKDLVKFIEKNPKQLDGKDLCLKFTVNNVAICAFGINDEAFESDSEFKNLAENFLSAANTLLFFIVLIVPKLRSIIKYKFTPDFVEKRLIEIVRGNIQSRILHNVVRHDFLQAVLDFKKNEKDNKDFDIEVAGHAAGFLLDGTESSAITMNFFLYHLATNKDVQDKLRQEINKKIEENGEFNYDTMQKMEYLDAAFSESQRMLPIFHGLSKVCSKNFDLNGVIIEKGTPVFLPVLSIQNDPKYWDEPEKYKPERFLKNYEGKKGPFFSFGEGPRMCLGMRFGSAQVKIGIVHILKNYEITLNRKTEEPIKLDPNSFLMSVVGGLWLDFKKIDSKS